MGKVRLKSIASLLAQAKYSEIAYMDDTEGRDEGSPRSAVKL